MVGGALCASASSVVRSIDEYQLFVCALAVVVNDLADNDEVMAAML